MNLIEFYFLTLGSDDFIFLSFWAVLLCSNIVRLEQKVHYMYCVQSLPFYERKFEKKKSVYDLKAQLKQKKIISHNFIRLFAASLSKLNGMKYCSRLDSTYGYKWNVYYGLLKIYCCWIKRFKQMQVVQICKKVYDLIDTYLYAFSAAKQQNIKIKRIIYRCLIYDHTKSYNSKHVIKHSTSVENEELYFQDERDWRYTGIFTPYSRIGGIKFYGDSNEVNLAMMISKVTEMSHL